MREETEKDREFTAGRIGEQYRRVKEEGVIDDESRELAQEDDVTGGG